MTTRQEAHVTDAEIIALLGSDDDVADQSSIDAHLRACSACAGRVAVISNQWNGFVGLLADTEPLISRERLPGTLAEVQRRRRGHRHQAQLRWAAGIILLVGIAFATPVRAWITDWVAQQWAAVAGSPQASDPPLTAESAPGNAPLPQIRHGLQFRPAGDEFTLVFDAPQPQGTVTIAVGNSPDAYIEVIGQGKPDPMMVFPTSLRVRNATSSARSYKLTLSPNVQLIRLQVRGEAIAEISTRQLGSNSRTIQLQEP